MRFTTKEISKTELELTIELTAAELLPYVNEAVKAISERTNIKGFRPGKVPYDILKQHVSEMSIQEEAAQKAISKSLFEALRQLSAKEAGKTIEIASQPKITIEKLAPNNAFIFKAVITKIPQVELGDIAKIKIDKKEITVAEADIDKTLKELQRLQAKESLTTDPAAKGDKVKINLTLLMNKVLVENGQLKDYPIVIGENTMIPGFEDQLIGMKKDDEKTFELAFPKNYYDANLAGKMGDFTVKCLDVYKRELPELNQDFAKTLGAESIEKLREAIKGNIHHENEHKEEQRQELAMLEKIVAESKFDEIPAVLIDRETHQMVHEMKHGLERQGLRWADYLSHLKKTEEDLEKDYREAAVKRVKEQLVIRAFARIHEIKITPEDLQKEVDQIIAYYKNDEEIKKNVQSSGYREYLSEMLINRKVIEYLKKEIIK